MPSSADREQLIAFFDAGVGGGFAASVVDQAHPFVPADSWLAVQPGDVVLVVAPAARVRSSQSALLVR
jgi:hypothetical protein